MYPIEYLWRAATRHPEHVAILGPAEDLTYRTLSRRVIEQAAALCTADPTPDGRVCVGAANSVEHLIAILAVLAAGKVWVPLNPRSGDPEINRLIDFVAPTLVWVDSGMRERLADGIGARLLDELTEGKDHAIGMGPLPGRAISLDRTQAIKFTGGTTGFPKGVKQPIRAWNTNIVSQIHTLRLSVHDRYLVAAPLTHGTSTYMLPLLASGGALIFPDDPGPAGLLAAAERHRATLLFAPPTLILALINEQKHAPRDLRTLRYLVYGGSPMRIEHIRAAQACFGPILCTSYGQTEAPQIVTFLQPSEMVGDDLASVGRPTLLTQVSILGPEGTALPAGEEGEIAVRGDLVMTGYLDAPQETERTLIEGWLHTGDAGVFDERGLLFLKDRLRDVIITGGFNVYPSDVETVIATHPAIADSAVFGVPDEKWGEAVHAAVQLREGYELDAVALQLLIKHEIGPVKTPKQIHIFDALPRSAVGKVLKGELRDAVLQRRKTAEHSS